MVTMLSAHPQSLVRSAVKVSLCEAIFIGMARSRLTKINFDFFLFLFKLPIDICGDLWYNRGVVHRALDGGQGPFFRSPNPIWNFSATSSDFRICPAFPKSSTPFKGADRESSYGDRFGWKSRSVKMFFFLIITYFFIKIKSAFGERRNRRSVIDFFKKILYNISTINKKCEVYTNGN